MYINSWTDGIILKKEQVEIPKEYFEHLKREYDLSAKEVKKLKLGNLFRLEYFFTSYCFDSNVIFWDSDNEIYFRTGDSEVIENIGKKDVIALVDEYGDCMTL